MPPILVLRERNAGPFERLGQDHQRFVPQPDRGQHLENFIHVVAVNLLGAPPERLESFLVNIQIVAESGCLALAETVHVHDGDKIVELVDAGERRGFPDRAFGDFTIAEQHVGSVIQLVQARTQRHAHAHAQALAERTGRHIHERQPGSGMSFKIAPDLAQLEQFLRREKAGLGPGRIQQRRRVTLRENESIVVEIVRVLWLIPHVPEEKRGHNVGRGTARGRVPAACSRRGGNRMNPQLIGDALQCLDVNIVHESTNCMRGKAKGK